MESIEAQRIYKKRYNASSYEADKHCVMVIRVISTKWRVSAFLKEAGIGDTTFYKWLQQYPDFRLCYEIARAYAFETWEQEEEDNTDNLEWDRKMWASKGSRYFSTDKNKIHLNVSEGSNPWEHYSEVMQQAKNGHFTASEIKQIMEAINVGKNVYESFKLQVELDKMKEELTIMSQRHGNNSGAVIKIA